MKQFGWIAIALAGLACACSEPSPASGPVVSDGVGSVIQDAIDRATAGLGEDGPAPFEVVVQLSDAYGNPSEVRALAFSWSAAARARINRENIDRYQLIDLASVSILDRRGVMAFAEWCDVNGRILTPRLCGPERRRSEDAWVARPQA